MDGTNLNSKLINNLIDTTVSNGKKTNFETKLKQAYGEDDKIKLKESCQEFEAIFLNMMYKEMRASVPKTDLIESSAGKEMYQSMLDEEMMKNASKAGNVGLGNDLFKFMSKHLNNLYKVDDSKK